MSDLLWDDPTWNKLKGWPAIILGNSPALNHVDLSLLDSIFTIGVNRILQVYTPDAVLLVDLEVLRQEEQLLKAHEGKVLLWDGLRKHQKLKPQLEIPGALRFPLADGKRTKTWQFARGGQDRTTLRVGTTPPYALQLAVLAGCNPIGLLGVDHSAGKTPKRNKTSHFYGHGGKLGATGGGPFTGRNERFWKDAKTWAKNLGVKVYSLTPFEDSPFNDSGWPKVSLGDFVKGAHSGELK